jgi:hypothetical protein
MPAWAAVAPGDAAAVAGARAARSGAVLLICYPPPTTDAMALAAVRAFAAGGGRRLALVGEWRGDTGSPALERYLAGAPGGVGGVERGDWALVATHGLPNFGNTAANMTLWERGGGGGGGAAHPARVAWPLHCVSCGALPPMVGERGAGKASSFVRDRLTRAVVACGPTCARSPAAVAALDAELAARGLPPVAGGRADAPEGGASAWGEVEAGEAAAAAGAGAEAVSDAGAPAKLSKRVWRQQALL